MYTLVTINIVVAVNIYESYKEHFWSLSDFVAMYHLSVYIGPFGTIVKFAYMSLSVFVACVLCLLH